MTEREILFNAVENIGWDEIKAFQEELSKGQCIYEDAGGYYKRAIARLLGIRPRNQILTYQQAAKAMFEEYLKND